MWAAKPPPGASLMVRVLPGEATAEPFETCVGSASASGASANVVAKYGPRSRNENGTVSVRGRSLFIAPMNHSCPRLRATTTYSPILPSSTRVSSQLVGTTLRNSAPGWPRYAPG